MSRLSYGIVAGILAAVCLGVVAYAQQPAQPPFATTKVDGTDNVYVFRYGGHQSMFALHASAHQASGRPAAAHDAAALQ